MMRFRSWVIDSTSLNPPYNIEDAIWPWGLPPLQVFQDAHHFTPQHLLTQVSTVYSPISTLTHPTVFLTNSRCFPAVPSVLPKQLITWPPQFPYLLHCHFSCLFLLLSDNFLHKLSLVSVFLSLLSYCFILCLPPSCLPQLLTCCLPCLDGFLHLC